MQNTTGDFAKLANEANRENPVKTMFEHERHIYKR
jgi:hypothetical protein